MKTIAICLVAAFALASSAAQAGTVVQNVDSHTGPWSTTVNSGFLYGYPDANPPDAPDNASPVSIGGFILNETVTISASGLTSEFDGIPPDTGPEGWLGFTSDNPGSSGGRFPGAYTASPETVGLGALIGAFANAAGVIQGTPFYIGTGTSVQATGEYLLLGINDDIYADNTGFLRVEITADSIASAVPEPATWAMMFLGFAGVGFLGYRRSRTGEHSALAS